MRAQSAPGQPLALTLDEAVQIAIERNYTVRSAALDVETANAQIREAWGQLYPRVDLSSSYTRNVVSANPFAGSDAGGLFGRSALSTGWPTTSKRAPTRMPRPPR